MSTLNSHDLEYKHIKRLLVYLLTCIVPTSALRMFVFCDKAF